MDALAQPGVRVTAEELLSLAALVRRGRRGARLRVSAFSGGAAIQRQGGGLDLHEIRPWAPGDEVRSIDRNASARRGELHTRLFRDEREPRHLVVVDLRPSMLFGTRRAFRSAAALEAACLVGWDLVQRGARLDMAVLMAAGPVPLRGGVGEPAMRALAGGLARLNDEALRERADRDPPLDEALAAATARAVVQGSLTLISALDSPGLDLAAALRTLGRRGAIRIVRIRDRIEAEIPAGRYAYATAGGPRRLAAIGRRGGPAPEADRALADLPIAQVTIGADAAPADMLATLGALDRERSR
jgi:uncharacterized protein (DUF58 family)